MNAPLFRSLKLAALALTTIFAVQAQAQMFTSQEIAKHNQNIDVITDKASACLTETYEDHVAFYRKWGVSKYYGNRKPEHATAEGRKRALRKYGAPDHLISELEPISCIGLAVRCLGEGFEAAGLGSTWKKIHAKLAEGNKFLGTDLQIILRELGWKTLYWNPDPASNAAWDQDDKNLSPLQPGRTWNPVWGGHAARYATVMRKGMYMNIPVDDAETLVGYKTNVPNAFKQMPFFIGTAHAGYHVFPGYNGRVIEAHSMRELNSFENLEVADFNPLGPGGGPRWTRTEKYRSGIIVVPPSR